MKLPEAFEENLKKMIGDEGLLLYKESLKKNVRHALRVNTGKISVEDFIKKCPAELTPIPWCKNGFYYNEDEFAASKHPFYFAGLYYLQEPSAMLPAATLNVKEGDKVLDICAAPGGKSTELLQRIGENGYLVTNDISASRAKALVKNIELFGGENILITCESPDKLAAQFEGYFDKILIDAPCSGEGMFRKKNSMISAWHEEINEEYAALQRSILKETVKMLRPGGELLYSTCTFSPLEDEESVAYLLSLDDSLHIVPFEVHSGFLPGNAEWSSYDDIPDIDKTMHLFPHRIEGEGHFVALIKKDDDASGASCAAGRYLPARCMIGEEVNEFLTHINKRFDPSRFEVFGEKLYYIPPECPDSRGLRVLRRGLLVGEIKKKRFEPSQALAMTLTPDTFDKVLDLAADDIRINKYLHGETIEFSEEELIEKSFGAAVSKKASSQNDKNTDKKKKNKDSKDKASGDFVLITVDGFSLGFGKLSNGVIKNKYLPGWRMMS